MPADFVIIGGGIVGVATARALLERRAGSVLVIEAEDRLAAHQSGHNSGVIHAGLYYAPGSLKARLCAEGREAMYELCARRGVPHRRCGKIVIACDEREIPALDELERRGRANGIEGIERLDQRGIRRFEPHAAGIAGLHVPVTGVVDFAAVTRELAAEVREAGGEIRTSAPLRAVRRAGGALVLTAGASTIECGRLINCAGLHSDRVARLCGVEPGCSIVPFRGEYWTIAPQRADLVRGLIYPVPDARLPFLGVHLTRMVDGTVEAGPNAVLGLSRHGYRRRDVRPRDVLEQLADPGLRRLVARYWRTGAAELLRSFSRRRFAAALQRLVPAIRPEDLRPGGCGVRAQAVDRDGTLVADFRIVEGEGTLHVLNAPSPAATASIAIGGYIAARVVGEAAPAEFKEQLKAGK